MPELEPLISLSEEQARGLSKAIAEIDIFHGLYLYRHVDDDILRIGSDAWPGEVLVKADGTVIFEDDEGTVPVADSPAAPITGLFDPADGSPDPVAPAR